MSVDVVVPPGARSRVTAEEYESWSVECVGIEIADGAVVNRSHVVAVS